MPTDATRWDEAVVRLIELTNGGQLTWQRSNVGRENTVGGVYLTEHNNKRIIVYEYRYRYYRDEDDWTWLEDVAIEFVDSDGNSEWRWPAVTLRHELLDRVRYTISGAEDFLHGLLGN